MCACVPLGALISCHVSSVFLISSPQGTGELFTRQYSLSLPTVSLVVLSGCVLLMILTFSCTSLYCIFHFFFLPPPPPPFLSKTETYHKIPMTFLSTLFLTLEFFWCNCADRAPGRLSLFSTARCQTKPLEKGLWRWTAFQWGVGTGEGRSPPDSAVSLHKSRQG